MSRAVNVSATHAEVVAMCANKKVGVSVIEPIQSGGTRVVLLNGHDAAVIASAFGKKVLAGDLSRTLVRVRQR